MTDSNSITPDSLTNKKEAKQRGDYLYAGKACRNCGNKVRYTNTGKCRDCKLENSRSESRKAYYRLYARRRKEQKKEYDRKRYRRTRESRLEKARQYYIDNRESKIAYAREYHAKNFARVRHWAATKKAKTKSDLYFEEYEYWILSTKKLCYWCGLDCASEYHVDHYEPLAKGGKHDLENLVIACPDCNRRKSDKDPYQFANSIGRLF